MDLVQGSSRFAARLQKLVLLAALAALPLFAGAQKKAEVLHKPAPSAGAVPPAEPTEPEPKLEVSVFPADKNRTVNAGFQVSVVVTNTTKEAITTLRVGACFPLAVGAVVGDAMVQADRRKAANPPPSDGKRAEDNTGAICWWLDTRHGPGKGTSDPIGIPSGRQANFSLDVPRVAPKLVAEQILFRRDAYPFHIDNWYTTKSDDTPRMNRTERAIELRAGLHAPLVGVLVGNLLVALFLSLRIEGPKVSAALAPDEGPVSGWRVIKATGDVGLSFGRMVISGFISGLILVVVLSQTDTPQLPVTVSINDFWGGAFLGLVSYKLSDWLYEKFFSRTVASANSDAANKAKADTQASPQTPGAKP